MNVSLIVPTLNCESTLNDCISSLKTQLSKGDEIIIVDSYSTDNTIKIAKKFKCKIIQTKANRSVARNIGWKKAKNDVIVFVEADSIYKKDYIKIIKKSISNSDCLLDKREHYKPKSWVSKVLQKEFEIKYDKNFVPITAWIIKKKVLKKVGGFDKNLEYAEDVDLGTRIKQAGFNIKFEPKAIQYHLGEPSNLSEVINRSWSFGKNMKPYHDKYNNHPLIKNTFFIFSIFYTPLLFLVFLINIFRYQKLELLDRIKLSFISIIRNITFAISYLLN